MAMRKTNRHCEVCNGIKANGCQCGRYLSKFQKSHQAKQSRSTLATMGATVTISGSGNIPPSLLQKVQALTQAINNQTQQNMPNGFLQSGSSGQGGWIPNQPSPNFVFTNPENGDCVIAQEGMEVVLLSGRGADGNPDANPIYEITGMVGHITRINVTSTGAPAIEVMWNNQFLNYYQQNYNNEVQYYGFMAKKKKAKKEFKLKEAALEPLVLANDVKKEILAVLKQHQHYDKLFDEWGLGKTIEYGRGMTMMFWGGPGTGKTYAAHCIAKAMGTKLLILSAAEIQSSEPGAANRNLQDAFKAAKEDGKVLFIDECDSLITSRQDLGMVLASEVNTLLTEIEKAEGVVILATNRIETMDEALERRIALIVEFPFPKYAQRIEIWKQLMPPEMPLGEGVTFEELAKERLSGGQIKNVLLQAARLALGDEAQVVSAEHFSRALTRLQKSQNLMGNVARSRYGRPSQNMQIGTDVTKTRSSDVNKFLSDELKDDKKHGDETNLS